MVFKRLSSVNLTVMKKKMKLHQTSTMTHTVTADDNQHSLSERLHCEHEEVNAITQPLLETEAGFIKDLDNYLSHRDTLDQRKRKLLHKRWTQSVWLPVQRSIQQHFAQHGYNETQKMRAMHAHYIDYCNAKGFVFLESYDPREYNPFLHNFNPQCFHKIFTPTLEDPLSLQSQARIKEKMAILRCQTGDAYRRQQVEEILQRQPVSRQSQPQTKAFRDFVPQRLWEDRRSRNTGASHTALAERRCFRPQCWSSYD